MKFAFKTVRTICNLLGKLKNKVEDFEKFGIYEIKCKYCDPMAHHLLQKCHLVYLFSFNLGTLKLKMSITDP